MPLKATRSDKFFTRESFVALDDLKEPSSLRFTVRIGSGYDGFGLPSHLCWSRWWNINSNPTTAEKVVPVSHTHDNTTAHEPAIVWLLLVAGLLCAPTAQRASAQRCSESVTEPLGCLAYRLRREVFAYACTLNALMVYPLVGAVAWWLHTTSRLDSRGLVVAASAAAVQHSNSFRFCSIRQRRVPIRYHFSVAYVTPPRANDGRRKVVTNR